MYIYTYIIKKTVFTNFLKQL